jgi:CIC family chloride channel protein
MWVGRRTWDELGAAAGAFVAQRWPRLLALRERLRLSEDAFHVILAVLIGVVAGLANFLFFLGTESAKWLTLGRSGDLAEIAEGLGPWGRLAAPAVGGLFAGLVLHWGLRVVGTQGSTNLLEVVVAGDGRLPFRTTLIKTVSSLISIASGASIGREGSLVQLSATLASQGGQRLRWPPYRLRLMVACGAAAGMAAAYNAPIGGAVFAAQIVLGNFAMNLFAPLVCASVTAAVVSRSFFGIEPWYQVPSFDFTSLTQLPWFVVLGAGSGALGAVFLKLLRQGERVFDWAGWPIYARVAVAGLAVGALAIQVPQVWGNGYAVTSRLLGGETVYGLWLVLGLLAAKLLATVLTVGAGTVGGVFTPTLFLGASLGGLFGQGLHALGLAQDLPSGAFALVGMGSVLAATTHAPLLAMIMVFEISLNYSLMPALMVACAVGTLVGRRLHPSSIYTEPLQRKGLLFEADSPQVGAALEKTVGDLMLAPVVPLRETTPLREIGQRFLTNPNNFLPVVDARQRLIGVVSLQDLKEHLNAGDELRAVIALDVMRPLPPCLTPNQKLRKALPVLLASEMRNVPVVNNFTEYRLTGSLSRGEALGLFADAIAARRAAPD